MGQWEDRFVTEQKVWPQMRSMQVSGVEPAACRALPAVEVVAHGTVSQSEVLHTNAVGGRSKTFVLE